MAEIRSSSWFEFLCEGTPSSLPRGASVPATMVEQFPEEVEARMMYLEDTRQQICPRILESKNCDQQNNCQCLHPDFVGGSWVVPNLLCHKWFQGTCQHGTGCWNQHGNTFDDAMRTANRVQALLRGRRAPFSYDPADGGTIKSVSRAEAVTMIHQTMARYRLDVMKSWRFGTNWTKYYDYRSWRNTNDAVQVRAAEQQRQLERRAPFRAQSPVARGRGVSPRRGLSPRPFHRQPAQWHDRPRASTPPRSSTPTRPQSSFPPARPATTASSSTTRNYFDGAPMETESDASSVPSFGRSQPTRTSFRQGDAEGMVTGGTTSTGSQRPVSPARTWLDSTSSTPTIIEITETLSPPAPPTSTTTGTPDLWDQCQEEVLRSRAAQQATSAPRTRDDYIDDAWNGEWINDDIPESARPATPPPTRSGDGRMVQVKAMPKTPIHLGLNSPSASTFRVTVSPDVFNRPNFPGFHDSRTRSNMASSSSTLTPAPTSVSSTNSPYSTNTPTTTPLPTPLQIDRFRVMWPETARQQKGPSALADLRMETPTTENPQFGFRTSRRFDGFPVLSSTLEPLVRLGSNNVAMLPPGNHPFAAFAADAPWEITYEGVYYVDQVLSCPTHRSTPTNFGVFVDLPVHCPDTHVLQQRVLLLGVPNNFNDPMITLIYSVVWHLITDSLRDLHHTSSDQYGRLRSWCCFARDLRNLSFTFAESPPISCMARHLSSAILDCTSSMIQPGVRSWFAQHEQIASFVTAEPPAFFLRFRG